MTLSASDAFQVSASTMVEPALLAEWFDEISKDGTGVAWISLDPSDSEPSIF